jgi:dTMP kinase
MFWEGKFIVLEGCEGAGKTTQIRLLADGLAAKGCRVLTTREPGGRPGADLGIAKIRALLVEAGNAWQPLTEMLLFAAARHEHVANVIAPALADGMTVVCDRFSDSTRAYQGHARGLGTQVCDTLRDVACGAVAPDFTVVVDIPAQEGLARSMKRATDATRFEQEELAFHERVREAFLAFAAADPSRYGVVDGRQPTPAVHAAIMAALTLKESGGRIHETERLLGS